MANVHPTIMNKKVEIWIFRLSRMVHDSIKSTELGFMVQDLFSGPKFVYSIPFWVYRGSVSVEQRQCLCGTDTVSVWDTHSVSVWDTHSPGWWAGGRAGGSRGTPTPHWGFPVPHTHTPKIAVPQLRGDYGSLLSQTGNIGCSGSDWPKGE